MGGTVEVLALEDLDDIRDRVLGQQHAAEHGLLGVQVLRGDALETAGPGAAVVVAFLTVAAAASLALAPPGAGGWQQVAGTGVRPGVFHGLGNAHPAPPPVRGADLAVLFFLTAQL